MKKYLLGSIVLFVMIGCGNSHSPSSTANATVKGVAVDDLIVNGVVRVYPANNSERVLATGRTDANGQYSLNVAYDGIAIVEVTCDQNSIMKNPVTGTTLPCAANLKLHSAANVTPHEEITVPVTPLTEAVVRQMDGDATPEKLDMARNNVGLMFGVDPLGDMPTEGTYSKIIDAIHTMAQEQNSSLTEVIDALAEDLSDGSAGDDGNVTQVLAKVMQDAHISNNLTGNNGVYTPPAGIAVSEITAAKAFFEELRTQTMSIVNYKESGTPGFLDREAEDIATALEDTTLDAEYVTEAVGHFIDAIGFMKENNLSSFSPNLEHGFMGTDMAVQWSASSSTSATDFNYTIGTEYQGTFSIPEDIDDLNLSNITDPLSANIQGTLPPKSSEETEQVFNAEATLSKVSNTVTLGLNAAISSGNERVAISNLHAQVILDANGSMDYMKINGLGVQASKGDYNFDGLLSFPTYVVNPTADVKGHYIPSAFSFDGTITDQSNNSSLNGNVSVVLKNATTTNLSGNSESMFAVTMAGHLRMPNRPVLNVTLGFENMAANSDEYSLSYSYDSAVVNGIAELDSEGENGLIDFTSTNGLHVHIILVNGEIDTAQSNVTKDGHIIGHFEERNGITVIKYADGSFESLP
jgi:hypothetical protein